MEHNETLEVLGTARVMRWFRPDPIPPELVDTLVWAATRAGSAHNSQPWDIVVVRNPDVRDRIGAAIAASVADNDPMPPATSDVDRRIERGVRNLFATMSSAPVFILICGRNCYPHANPDEKFMWTALGAAAQNLVIAARSLGLGVATTMFHVLAEPQIREIVGVPDDRVIGYTTIVGWPDRQFGPLSRRASEEVVRLRRVVTHNATAPTCPGDRVAITVRVPGADRESPPR